MRAIDVHVHPSTRGLDTHACNYFRRDLSEVPQTADGFADVYLQHDVKALLIGWHPSTVTRARAIPTSTPSSSCPTIPSLLPACSRRSIPFDRFARESPAMPKSWCGIQRSSALNFIRPTRAFIRAIKDFTTSGKFLQAGGKPAMFHIGFTVLGANTPWRQRHRSRLRTSDSSRYAGQGFSAHENSRRTSGLAVG